MSASDGVRNTLAPGHSQPEYANHRDHTSKYTVTKLQNCQYTYTNTAAAGNKAGKTQDTDDDDDKPGGTSHMTATHPETGGQTDANGNNWQTGIDTATAKYYSGFTGRHEDDSYITSIVFHTM